MLRSLRTIAACAITLVAASASAQDLHAKMVVHKLDNGMTVLIYPRTTTPVFAAALSMDVAGSDESYGESGVAHMFEHMAFKGTHTIGTRDLAAEEPLMQKMDEIAEAARVELGQPEPDMAKVDAMRAQIAELQAEQSKFIVKDELDEVLARNGATGVNASTGADFTTYYTSLPSNRLEFYFWLEADRMKNPVMREFYSERDVVLEERRMRTDNTPDGMLDEAFTSAAFDAHPYGRPIIGWASEISSITRPMAEDFRRRFYGPKSAVLAIVGDVDPQEVIRLSNKYFGDWDAPGQPQRLVTRDPIQRGEKRLSVKYDAEPMINIGWHKPTEPSRDDAAFAILSHILTSGNTARFYRELVVDKKIIADVAAYSGPGEKYDNLFTIIAEPLAPHTVQEAEAAIYESLDKVLADGVTEEELKRAKKNIEMMYLRRARTDMGFATALASTANLRKDPYGYTLERDELLSVTREEIQDAAKRWLTKDNRTVGWLERP